MTKIITCSELRYRTLAELHALYRALQIELECAAPGSAERAIALASLESVRRVMAMCLTRRQYGRRSGAYLVGFLVSSEPVSAVEGLPR